MGATTTTSNFILDGEDLARTTTAGTATLYAFSPEGLMASSTGGSARFFLKDLHGDTVGAVDASGSVMGSKLYSPWGEPAASAGETYSAGFQSQPTDADTGYVDMTTRLYSPTQGRFSSRDILFGDTDSPSSMNQYAYAGGNPVTMWDPTGMKQACNPSDTGLKDLYWTGGGHSRFRGRICAYSMEGLNRIDGTGSVLLRRADHIRVAELLVFIFWYDDDGDDTNNKHNPVLLDLDLEPVVLQSATTSYSYKSGDSTNNCHASMRGIVEWDNGRRVSRTHLYSSGQLGCM